LGPGNHSAYCGTAYVVGVKIVRGNQGVLRGLAAAMKLWELDVDVGSSEVHGGGGSKSTNTNNTDSTRLHHSCEETGWALATETRRSVSDNIPYHTLPYHTLPYLTIPYLTIPYLTIPYLTIPYLTIPYHTIPYHTLPYHTVPTRCPVST
jgi:hypothetical protein